MTTRRDLEFLDHDMTIVHISDEIRAKLESESERLIAGTMNNTYAVVRRLYRLHSVGVVIVVLLSVHVLLLTALVVLMVYRSSGG